MGDDRSWPSVWWRWGPRWGWQWQTGTGARLGCFFSSVCSWWRLVHSQGSCWWWLHTAYKSRKLLDQSSVFMNSAALPWLVTIYWYFCPSKEPCWPLAILPEAPLLVLQTLAGLVLSPPLQHPTGKGDGTTGCLQSRPQDSCGTQPAERGAGFGDLETLQAHLALQTFQEAPLQSQLRSNLRCRPPASALDSRGRGSRSGPGAVSP